MLQTIQLVLMDWQITKTVDPLTTEGLDPNNTFINFQISPWS